MARHRPNQRYENFRHGLFGAWEPALIGVMGSVALVFMLAYARACFGQYTQS